MKKNDQKHLPIYGVGPLYGSIIILMSAVSVILSGNRILYIGIPQYLDTLFIVYAWDIYMGKSCLNR